mmetsp:Transcript_22562/g.49062  ORF Transcript_22562/g.49062 Transcript_22562/m.49062 type:complete len:315 (-) Transcript_22562:144-1088(-)
METSPISVPLNPALMLAVQLSSFHSTSILSSGVRVAVKELSSPRDRSHATEISPLRLIVGETLLSSSICCEMVTSWLSADAVNTMLVLSMVWSRTTSWASFEAVNCTLVSPMLWLMTTSWLSADAVSSTLVSSLAYVTTTSASSEASEYFGVIEREAPSKSMFLVAEMVSTPPSIEATTCTERSTSSLAAFTSMSVSPLPISLVAPAETPHPARLVLRVPKTFFGRDATSVVGRTAASIPYSRSTSPAAEAPDQERVGSKPSTPSYFPSQTEMESEGLATALAEARTEASAKRVNFILIDYWRGFVNAFRLSEL